MTSPFFSQEELARMSPICDIRRSDSSNLDSIIEMLVFGGRSLPHAMMMLIPEAWAGNPLMDEERRAFYEFHAAIMEPWDGPAAVAFTDGRQIGATLDRNGLRPARWLLTADRTLVVASETGVYDVAGDEVVAKGKLGPGEMLAVDLQRGEAEWSGGNLYFDQWDYRFEWTVLPRDGRG